jgi:hypothetical protein
MNRLLLPEWLIAQNNHLCFEPIKQENWLNFSFDSYNENNVFHQIIDKLPQHYPILKINKITYCLIRYLADNHNLFEKYNQQQKRVYNTIMSEISLFFKVLQKEKNEIKKHIEHILDKNPYKNDCYSIMLAFYNNLNESYFTKHAKKNFISIIYFLKYLLKQVSSTLPFEYTIKLLKNTISYQEYFAYHVYELVQIVDNNIALQLRYFILNATEKVFEMYNKYYFILKESEGLYSSLVFLSMDFFENV